MRPTGLEKIEGRESDAAKRGSGESVEDCSNRESKRKDNRKEIGVYEIEKRKEINRFCNRECFRRLTVLGETDSVGTLTEALTADVDAVLADQTSLVLADSAAAGALTVLAGVGEPDSLVSHIESE